MRRRARPSPFPEKKGKGKKFFWWISEKGEWTNEYRTGISETKPTKSGFFPSKTQMKIQKANMGRKSSSFGVDSRTGKNKNRQKLRFSVPEGLVAGGGLLLINRKTNGGSGGFFPRKGPKKPSKNAHSPPRENREKRTYNLFKLTLCCLGVGSNMTGQKWYRTAIWKNQSYDF